MLSTRISEVRRCSAHEVDYIKATHLASGTQAHIETYTRNILGTFKDDPLFQFVQINMQENKLKWALLSLFLSSLRRSVPEDYRSTYLVSTQSLEYLKEVRFEVFPDLFER